MRHLVYLSKEAQARIKTHAPLLERRGFVHLNDRLRKSSFLGHSFVIKKNLLAIYHILVYSFHTHTAPSHHYKSIFDNRDPAGVRAR